MGISIRSGRWEGLRCGALGLALLCLGTVAGRADEKADKAAIQAVFATHARGYRNKDAKVMFSIYTPDAKIKNNGIEYGIPQLKGMFAQQVERIRSIQEYKEELSGLEIHGKNATVAVHVTFKGKAIDPRNILRDLSQIEDEEDTLIKTSSGWKVKHSTIVKFQIFVDGRPVSNGR